MPNNFQYLAQPMAPNILGAFEQGRSQTRQVERERLADQELQARVGRENQFRQLAGQAYGAQTPADQQQYLTQAAAVDPQGAGALGQNLGSQEDRRKQRIGLMAGALTKLPAEQRPMLYQNMLPELRQLGLNAPDQYGPEIDDVAQSLAAVLSGQLPQRSPASVQEWQFYEGLPEAQKRAYLTMKRADPTFKMGDVQMVGDPVRRTATPFAEESGRTQGDVQRELSGQAAEKTAMEENVKAASKLADESFKRLESVKTNLANYDEAIRLIDEGAQTGVIASRLPSVRQASIALDNLQGRLGLDVIGNTTFGALSEAELKFALETALPQRLEGPALKQWLQGKKAAQQKLAAYLEQASIFLGTPGNTVKDWIEIQGGGRSSGRPQQSAPAPGAPQGAPASAPVRVSSPQEAMALPPGTQFVTPDGRVKVRP